jgi:hypothetical protein
MIDPVIERYRQIAGDTIPVSVMIKISEALNSEAEQLTLTRAEAAALIVSFDDIMRIGNADDVV